MKATKDQFLARLYEYGDACFDCGEWQKDTDADMPYETLYERQQKALRAVIKAFEKSAQ